MKGDVRAIEHAYAEAVLQAFVLMYGDMQAPLKREVICPRCLRPFRYRMRGTKQPTYCTACTKSS